MGSLSWVIRRKMTAIYRERTVSRDSQRTILDEDRTSANYCFLLLIFPLQWRRNGRDGVSNHQPHDCLLSRFFRRRSKKTSKLRVTGLWVRNSLVTGEFPARWPVTRKMFPFDDVIMFNHSFLYGVIPELRPTIDVASYIPLQFRPLWHVFGVVFVIKTDVYYVVIDTCGDNFWYKTHS